MGLKRAKRSRYNGEVGGWIRDNWFFLVQTCGIVSALGFVGLGFFFDFRARQVGNLIKLTDRHRDLWERMYSDPKLTRILESAADPGHFEVTSEEKIFVVFLILHLANTYYTVRSGFLKQPQGLAADIRRFFTLPIPMAVWESVRDLQDRAFVKFVERCLSERDGFRPNTTTGPRAPFQNFPQSGPTTKARRRSSQKPAVPSQK